MDSIKGVLSGEDGKIYTEYGVIDPRTGNIQVTDPNSGKQENKQAQVDTKTDDDKVHTEFGVIDPSTGQITITDPVTGKQEIKKASVDPKTGNLLLTAGVIDPNTKQVDPSLGQQFTVMSKPKDTFASVPGKEVQIVVITSHLILTGNIVDPKTGKVDTSLAQQFSVVDKDIKPVEREIHLVIITTKYDPRTKKIDASQAYVDTISGTLGMDGKIRTELGIIDPSNGEIVLKDPQSGQKQTKNGTVLSETGQIFINSGAIDPKTGKIDPNMGMILSVAKQDDPVVDITAITGPIDQKTGKVLLDESSVEHTKGKVDAETGNIQTKYGVINPSNGVIFVSDASGSQAKPISIDENNGQITIRGVVDPKTGKIDPNVGQLLVVGSHIDPVVEVTSFVGKVDSKKGIIEPKNSVIESTTGQLNPDNNIIDTKYGQIDLVKGTVTYNDPKTASQVDPGRPQLTTISIPRPRHSRWRRRPQEQRVVTQEVKTTVTTGDQLTRHGSESSLSSGDSGTPIDFDGGEGHYYVTEPGAYRTTSTSTVTANAPFGNMVHGATTRSSVAPQSVTVTEMAEEGEAGEEGETGAAGEVVSSQTISSKTRTVETITYKTERNGVVETRVEQKITIQSDGDPIDHDRALAEAIQEATAMNPDMTVEKIEIQQQSTQP
ncbi:protein 4.1 homolog [Leptidea sinapis]|uniref:protein 4.1 homolog n=1 Tax=Leptidea sinapis TaxID=189913 RepID=UPI0021C347B9|nr:protein 4.1 homolog [Leptidea sinapis]